MMSQTSFISRSARALLLVTSSLAAAMADGGTATAQTVPEGLSSASDGNNVSLATEMTLMQENSLASQTVDNALSDQFTVLSDAITG